MTIENEIYKKRERENETGEIFNPNDPVTIFKEDYSGMENIQAHMVSSSIIVGGTLSINAGDNTKFDVSRTIAIFVDRTNIENPIHKIVEIAEQIGLEINFLTTNLVTYIGIDNQGNVTQKEINFSNEENRDIVRLGIIRHINKTTITETVNDKQAGIDILLQLNDLAKGLGIFKISGNSVEEDGQTKHIQVKSGEIYSKNINYEVNKKDPSTLVTTEYKTSTDNLTYMLPDHTLETIEGVDVNYYYNETTEAKTELPSNSKVGIHGILRTKRGYVRAIYGNRFFDSIDEATKKARISDFAIPEALEDNFILLAFIIAKKETTDLTDIKKALIQNTGKLGDKVGGGGTTSQGTNFKTHKFTSIETHDFITGLTAEKLINLNINTKKLISGAVEIHTDNNFLEKVEAGKDFNTVIKASQKVELKTKNNFYDISTATFNQVALYVGSQEVSPTAMLFNDTGTILYVMGTSGDDINEYTLATEFDISTATFNQVALSVGAQEASPAAMIFNNTGTKLYVMGTSGDDINEYTLITEYDISTATFNRVALSVGSQELSPTAMLFNNTGTKLYVMGTSGDDINEYTLATEFDISTATFNKIALTLGSQEANPRTMIFNDIGTKLYVMGYSGDDINEYTLTTEYDISTATFNRVALTVSAKETNPAIMMFNDTGTKLYVMGYAGDDINEYTLTTEYEGEVLSTINHN